MHAFKIEDFNSEALDLVLLFLRSKNNNKHGPPKRDNQALCACMQGALDCNPSGDHSFPSGNNQGHLKSCSARILTALDHGNPSGYNQGLRC